MKYLIVNADDFGLAKSVNEGIAKAFSEGIVTAISALSTGEAFGNALGLLRGLGLKDIGAHLSLTLTRPVTDPLKIPTLINNRTGSFMQRSGLFYKIMSGRIDPEQMHLELKNQLEKIRSAGIPVSNLSSHEHIHMIPKVLDIFIRLAKEYDIPAIRYVNEENGCGKLSLTKFYKSTIQSIFRVSMEKFLDGSGVRHPDRILGFLDSGNIDEKCLIRMLEDVREGLTELVTHPGFMSPEVLDNYRFHKNCEFELGALTSPKVKRFISDRRIKLVSYLEIITTRM